MNPKFYKEKLSKISQSNGEGGLSLWHYNITYHSSYKVDEDTTIVGEASAEGFFPDSVGIRVGDRITIFGKSANAGTNVIMVDYFVETVIPNIKLVIVGTSDSTEALSQAVGILYDNVKEIETKISTIDEDIEGIDVRVSALETPETSTDTQ